MKRIIIIAGPNGAGKTTFANEFLPHEADCPNFINADLIAAGLSPFDPDAADIQAGRVMLAEMKRYVANGESFAFETTLSGRHYVKQIRKWQAAGYRIELIYLRLPSIRMALAPRSEPGGSRWTFCARGGRATAVQSWLEQLRTNLSSDRRSLDRVR